MQNWVLVLLTGMFTLGGVALGNYLTARQAATQRAEVRREYLHRTLTDVLVDGREAIEVAWTLLPAFAMMTDNNMTQWVNSDSAKEAIDRNRRLKAGLVSARLLIKDEPLATRLAIFSQCFDDMPEKANGPVLSWRRTGLNKMDAIAQGFKHVGTTQRVPRA